RIFLRRVEYLRRSVGRVVAPMQLDAADHQHHTGQRACIIKTDVRVRGRKVDLELPTTFMDAFEPEQRCRDFAQLEVCAFGLHHGRLAFLWSRSRPESPWLSDWLGATGSYSAVAGSRGILTHGFRLAKGRPEVLRSRHLAMGDCVQRRGVAAGLAPNGFSTISSQCLIEALR